MCFYRYIAGRHLKAIGAHLGGPLKAANTLADLFTENPTLVQQISKQTLKMFVSLVGKHGKRPHFIRLLYMMCGTQKYPVLNNQNLLKEFMWTDIKMFFYQVSTYESQQTLLSKTRSLFQKCIIVVQSTLCTPTYKPFIGVNTPHCSAFRCNNLQYAFVMRTLTLEEETVRCMCWLVVMLIALNRWSVEYIM